MSTCKLWRDRQQGQHSDKGSGPSRTTPSLLRLDSTGEVTSVKPYTGQTANMCPDKRNCCFTCKPRNLSIQSMWNTANSYINTATSYLGSIYPNKTRKCLVDNTSATESMNLGQYFDHNKCVMSRVTEGVEGTWPQSVGNTNSRMGCQFTQGLKKVWTQDFIGALHSTVFNKEASPSSCLKSDRYIPPPIKHRLLQEKQLSAVIKDPKLTPYNAKLLEKSKRKDNVSVKVPSPNMTKIPEPVEPRQPENHSVKTHPQSDVGVNDTQNSTSAAANKNSTEKSDLKQTENECELPEVNSSSSVTDWFEYENNDENAMPVSVDEQVMQKAVKSDKASSIDQDTDTQDKMLHSWFSMDNDKDVKKSLSASNIPLLSSSSQNLCDKNGCSVNDPCSDSGVRVSTVENKVPEAATNVSHKSKQEMKDETFTKTDNVPKKQSEDSQDTERKTHLMSVLFIRNCGQKSRPSAQKRSRHKPHKKDASNNSCKDAKSLKEGNSVHPNSSVAFILGLDHNQVDSCFSERSFQVSCDIDDLDWSSCDEEDSQFDDVDGCNEFDFFSPLSFVNLQVTCSVPSTQPTSYTDSLLDRVNLEWELNMSVKPEYEEKKPNKSKKVHFKEDETLATVHPMVAWAHAYQAARKGPWEEIARDRGRFQRRITDGEKLLKPILQTEHRNQIFKTRFESEHVDA